MSWLSILYALAPENALLAGIVALTLVAIVMDRPRGLLLLTFAAMAAAAAMAWMHYRTGFDLTPFPGQFSVDPTGSLAKAAVLALSLPVLLLARDEFADDAPFHILILCALYGFCLLLSADSFLTLFLGLEIMSMPVYALVLLGYRTPQAPEAALKYLVLGGTATAMLLMGISLLYGGTGSLALTVFAAALSGRDLLSTAAVVLVLAAFFLKAAIVPFHAWAPDAYEGASVPVTAFMATVVKAGVLFAALRLFGTALVERPLVDLIAILPLVSIVWGNLAAMRQTSFRRMIAYSSIAHAGYLFYAFLGDGAGRFQAVVFYVVAYGFMNVLAFASLPRAGEGAQDDRIDDLAGLSGRRPFAAVMIAMAMLSLAGIPPFPGFVAKFLIFSNVLAAGYTVYAVLGLVGSYLGIYFYLRVIQTMFMSATAAAAPWRLHSGTAFAAVLLCLAPMILMAVFPGWFLALLPF